MFIKVIKNWGKNRAKKNHEIERNTFFRKARESIAKAEQEIGERRNILKKK
jgi:hypothetical protein